MGPSSEGGSSFCIPMDEICRTLKEKGYRKVLLQVPEGLKREAVSIASELEKRSGSSFIVDGEICFGACDHAGTRAYLLGLEAVIHLGHADIPSMSSRCSVPVHFFPTPMNANPDQLLDGLHHILDKSEGKRIGLATTVQHLGLLGTLRKELESEGFEVLIGGPGRREEFPGQVLGCSFRSPEAISGSVDLLIYIGTGDFHPIGLVSAVRKTVWAIDPMTGSVTRYDQKELDSFLRKRWAAIAAARERIESGGLIGVVIGSKPGQNRKDLAGRALSACREEGHLSSPIVMDDLDPMKLHSLGIDVAVITACPRIAYDDAPRYAAENVVVITYDELMIVIGRKIWEEYTFDERW
ncbi:MAG: diphthamide biosynthesis enzyme Dph2 [Candidatus Thermoplasmatota archaeon]|nr:diphthamide biosynthesis enzyme Dph2 [Candidatus Thermoplasmatota archaeon]